MKKIFNDKLLLFFAALILLLFPFSLVPIYALPSLIHWPTIVTLAALLIITTGIQQSGVMERGAYRLIRSIKTGRALWLVLILFSAVSAMILTNDIALFLVIPFTLQLNERVPLNIRPLLIFETIAVNVGSMLTPIGNPQNIYLWQKTGTAFFSFAADLIPPFVIQIGILLIAIFIIAKKDRLKTIPKRQQSTTDYNLASVSIALLIGYLIAKNLGMGVAAAGFIFAVFLLFFRHIIFRADWSLIILFILLFVDTGLIQSFHWVDSLMASISLSNPLHILLAGSGFSQIISNVPATLLLSHYTDQWKYLAWGVNMGGNGLLIASFANLITIRLAVKKNLWISYHFYAIPFLLISTLLTCIWIII